MSRTSSLHLFCNIIVSSLTCPLAAFTHFAGRQILFGSLPLPPHEAPAQAALAPFRPLLPIRHRRRRRALDVLSSLLIARCPILFQLTRGRRFAFLEGKRSLIRPKFARAGL